MDRWDMLCIAIAGYVSIISLVRLMANRRNELVDKIRAEIAKQRAAARASRPEPAEQNDQEAA